VLNRDAATKQLTLMITFVLLTLGQTEVQKNRGSAKYMLPFCQTWLKVAAEQDPEAVGSILKREEPIRLTSSGKCAGLVVGIAETLRMVELACPPEHVSDEPLVRMVIAEIEKHPEQLGEIVLASEVMMAYWPCKDVVLPFK
jgi:Rap1a immunity proteins